MGQHRLRQPSADALAAINLSDDNVRPVGVGREVGNSTPERDQGLTIEDGEADGVVDCPGERLGCERTAPIGRAEQSEYGRGVEAPTIRGQAERATLADASIENPWAPVKEVLARPNGSRLSCGRSARRRKMVERQTKRLGSEATQFFLTCERPPASSAC